MPGRSMRRSQLLCVLSCCPSSCCSAVHTAAGPVSQLTVFCCLSCSQQQPCQHTFDSMK